MVDREEISITDPLVKCTQPVVRGYDPVRMPSGKWRWNIKIELVLILPDGRELVVDDIVTVRPKQKGRKPNPNQVGFTKK